MYQLWSIIDTYNAILETLTEQEHHGKIFRTEATLSLRLTCCKDVKYKNIRIDDFRYFQT